MIARVINLALLTALVIAIPLSHMALSKRKKAATKKAAKVDICHFQGPTAGPHIGPFFPYPQVPLGWRRVRISRSAAAAHLLKHFDCTDFVMLDSGEECRCPCLENCVKVRDECLAAGGDVATCAAEAERCREACETDS
jgi:hypothetical protein